MTKNIFYFEICEEQMPEEIAHGVKKNYFWLSETVQ